MDKEVENPTPLEERFHYNSRIQGSEAKLGREFELGYNNPELLSEAFEYAASKILGDGHGITLVLKKGGDYGEAEHPGKERAMFTYKGLQMEPEGNFNYGCSTAEQMFRFGVNVPWGVYSMAVPQAPSGIAPLMQKLMVSFGLEGDGEAAWRVITVADGC